MGQRIVLPIQTHKDILVRAPVLFQLHQSIRRGNIFHTLHMVYLCNFIFHIFNLFPAQVSLQENGNANGILHLPQHIPQIAPYAVGKG